ncbi:hypothetical protein LCGC14_2787520 [marine sediment metagenome]|uniref:Uncharacterized protein n=1 Tax=marine sediment metagenome TaxID=412755 RepID=A0A0F9B054_9ZZZZ
MRTDKQIEKDKAITLIEKYIIELEEALYWMRALYPDAQLLNDLGDDNNTGCHAICSINTPTIAELQKIDDTLGG